MGIAAVVSGRRYPQLIPVVGPFVDTVVLRARVEPGMPFAGLLGQLRDFDVAALDRAAAPIEDVLRSTGLSTPQVALALQDFTIPALHVGDLSIEAHETEPTTADFDIRFTLWHNESGGLTGRLLHDVSRFARPDAELLARQFTAVVGAAAAAPAPPWGICRCSPRRRGCRGRLRADDPGLDAAGPRGGVFRSARGDRR
ncbi:hypothetical protein GS448_26225 [Rhodococcus hoagii]|nr:hypothetical protein [Prescottella equi]